MAHGCKAATGCATRLTRPIVSEPGTAMEYSTGSSHLLSAILTKATGTSTWQFAQDALAKPLGISLARWPQDPQGIYFGGNEMLLAPKQMVAIGELYLKRGRANGRQIVPASWVDTSCVPRTTSVWDSDRRYGYGWWIQDFRGGTACFAWGYGGQYIFVFRELDLVVAATSSTAVSEERRGHRRQAVRAHRGARAAAAGRGFTVRADAGAGDPHAALSFRDVVSGFSRTVTGPPACPEVFRRDKCLAGLVVTAISADNPGSRTSNRPDCENRRIVPSQRAVRQRSPSRS